METYLGFSETQMINGLMLSSKVFKLEKIENARDGLPEFRLYVLSDEFGEFECEGSLLYVLGQASAPYRERWKKENDDFRNKLNDLHLNDLRNRLDDATKSISHTPPTRWQRLKQAVQNEWISVRLYPKTYLTAAAALGLLVAVGAVLLW